MTHAVAVSTGWSFTSQAEYTSADDCREQVALMYGGAFAGDGMHRVVAIKREILD